MHNLSKFGPEPGYLQFPCMLIVLNCMLNYPVCLRKWKEIVCHFTFLFFDFCQIPVISIYLAQLNSILCFWLVHNAINCGQGGKCSVFVFCEIIMCTGEMSFSWIVPIPTLAVFPTSEYMHGTGSVQDCSRSEKCQRLAPMT